MAKLTPEQRVLSRRRDAALRVAAFAAKCAADSTRAERIRVGWAELAATKCAEAELLAVQLASPPLAIKPTPKPPAPPRHQKPKGPPPTTPRACRACGSHDLRIYRRSGVPELRCAGCGRSPSEKLAKRAVRRAAVTEWL